MLRSHGQEMPVSDTLPSLEHAGKSAGKNKSIEAYTNASRRGRPPREERRILAGREKNGILSMRKLYTQIILIIPYKHASGGVPNLPFLLFALI